MPKVMILKSIILTKPLFVFIIQSLIRVGHNFYGDFYFYCFHAAILNFAKSVEQNPK